ncbi:MAG: 2-hydroxyacid dehydrogenase [Patescibacteria group bacterium]
MNNKKAISRKKIKIVSLDKVALLDAHVKKLKEICSLELFNEPPKNIDDTKVRLENADILLVNTFNVNESVLDLCKNVKLLCVFGTGYNFIDITKAANKKILVCNVPGYSTEATAEHVIYLMLSSIRFSSLAERELRMGMWNPHKYNGHELKGKTLGIIGYGKIGKRIGQIAAKGFGMGLLHVNSKSTKKELHNLFKKSDVISLNVPFTEKTKNMISAYEFSIMKNNVIIVNASRGGVVDEKELVKALKTGKVSSGGFDVFCTEPINKMNELLSLNNAVLTPHMAFKTKESSFRISDIVVKNIIAFIENKPINVVNNFKNLKNIHGK